MIARHFSKPSLAAILRSLEKDAPGDEFAEKTLATLAEKSPTSLAVTYRELAAGLTLSMDDCMRMEYRIVSRMLAGHDFFEGIRATIIDKDNAPAWRPDQVGAVAQADVDAYFAALPDGDLQL